MITEAKAAGYAKQAPVFKDVPKQMKAAGMAASSRDAMIFILQVLSRLDVISPEEFEAAKKGQHRERMEKLMTILKNNEETINGKEKEIVEFINNNLDNYTSAAGTDRGRVEKYKETAKKISKEVANVAAGKEADDALRDILYFVDETLEDAQITKAEGDTAETGPVRAAVDATMAELRKMHQDDPDDIPPYVIEDLEEITPKIERMDQLDSFIKQLAAFTKEDSYYEKPVLYFMDAAKKAKQVAAEDSETHATDPKFEEEKTAALDIAGGNPGFGYDQVKARIEDKIGRECTEQECEDIKDALNHEADGMLGTYDMRGIEDGEGKHDDNDGKDERCDYVPCEDGEHAGYSVGNMIVGYDGEEIVTAVEEDGTIFTRELGDGGNKYEDGEHAGSSVGDMIDGYDGEEIVTAVQEDGTIFTRELGDGGNKYSPEQFNDIKPIGEDNEVTQLDPAAMETIDVMIGAAMDMEDVEYPEVKGMVEAGIGRACTDEELAYLMDELGVDPHDFELEPEDNEEVVSENKYTTSDSLLDVYATVKPIVEVVVESTTVNENGQTTPTQQYLAEKAEEAIEEVYTAQYLMEQKENDSYKKSPNKETVSFKERFQPKTHWQLEELRRYGL